MTKGKAHLFCLDDLLHMGLFGCVEVGDVHNWRIEEGKGGRWVTMEARCFLVKESFRELRRGVTSIKVPAYSGNPPVHFSLRPLLDEYFIHPWSHVTAP